MPFAQQPLHGHALLGMAETVLSILTFGQFVVLTSLLYGDGIGRHNAIINSSLTLYFVIDYA